MWSAENIHNRITVYDVDSRPACFKAPRRENQTVSGNGFEEFRSRCKETPDFSIQVENPIFGQASQLRAYRGLADAADAR